MSRGVKLIKQNDGYLKAVAEEPQGPVEVASSRDGAFLAVMLLQFIHMSYEPVTEVFVFEGDDARNVAKLF